MVKSSTRLKKWIARTNPSLVSQAYEASRPIQLDLGGQSQLKHDAVIAKIKAILKDKITNPYETSMYISYGQKVASIADKHTGKVAAMHVAGEITKWATRGLSMENMITIAREFGIDPMPYLLPAGIPPEALKELYDKITELENRVSILEHTVRVPYLILDMDLTIPEGWILHSVFGPIIVSANLYISGIVIVGG